MRKRMTRKDGLETLFQAAGTVTAVAERIGISVQTVSQWDRVPAEHCLALEAAFGVSREVLRPDIYGEGPSHPLERRTEAA